MIRTHVQLEHTIRSLEWLRILTAMLAHPDGFVKKELPTRSVMGVSVLRVSLNVSLGSSLHIELS